MTGKALAIGAALIGILALASPTHAEEPGLVPSTPTSRPAQERTPPPTPLNPSMTSRPVQERTPQPPQVPQVTLPPTDTE